MPARAVASHRCIAHRTTADHPGEVCFILGMVSFSGAGAAGADAGAQLAVAVALPEPPELLRECDFIRITFGDAGISSYSACGLVIGSFFGEIDPAPPDSRSLALLPPGPKTSGPGREGNDDCA